MDGDGRFSTDNEAAVVILDEVLGYLYSAAHVPAMPVSVLQTVPAV
jgi:hypothetical protein